jgi:tRNA G18 (ribose-2'-O)-methylase SpoU
MRGYFEIGIYHHKTPMNLGTLWRSASQLGATGIFTIGSRYPKQASDTLKTWRHVPLREHATWDLFLLSRPYDAPLVAVEMGGTPLAQFKHPERAVYLLGAEDHGLPKEILAKCQHVVSLESVRTESYNVAVAGSLVMWHRCFGSASNMGA